MGLWLILVYDIGYILIPKCLIKLSIVSDLCYFIRFDLRTNVIREIYFSIPHFESVLLSLVQVLMSLIFLYCSLDYTYLR